MTSATGALPLLYAALPEGRPRGFPFVARKPAPINSTEHPSPVASRSPGAGPSRSVRPGPRCRRCGSISDVARTAPGNSSPQCSNRLVCVRHGHDPDRGKRRKVAYVDIALPAQAQQAAGTLHPDQGSATSVTIAWWPSACPAASPRTRHPLVDARGQPESIYQQMPARHPDQDACIYGWTLGIC